MGMSVASPRGFFTVRTRVCKGIVGIAAFSAAMPTSTEVADVVVGTVLGCVSEFAALEALLQGDNVLDGGSCVVDYDGCLMLYHYHSYFRWHTDDGHGLCAPNNVDFLC